MGTSGIFLLKTKDYNPDVELSNVICAAKKGGLFTTCIEKEYDQKSKSFKYATVNITEYEHYDDENLEDDLSTEADGVLLYIYSLGSITNTEFDWVEPGLDTLICIENFRDCEKLLLSFVYEYLSLNPIAYFWTENKWVYTYKDICKIKGQPFNEAWCYENPHL